MTILDSLKALLKKMGGTSAASTNTISEVIGEITSAYQNGGGGGGGVLVCNVTNDGNTGTLDHTWQEVHDVLAVMVHFEYGENKTKIGWMVGVSIEDGVYYCDFIIGQEGDTTVISFETDNANGYPSATFS